MKINSINVTTDHDEIHAITNALEVAQEYYQDKVDDIEDTEEFNEIESFIEELEKLRYKLYDVENKTNELKEILYEKAKNKPQR